MSDVQILSQYERDEYLWMQEQIALLRAGKLDSLDREHLISFLEDMSARDRRELRNHFVVLLQHMLKFVVQPERASGSWAGSIAEQQDQIEDMLTTSPGLGQHALSLYAAAYPSAVRRASADTGMSASHFPEINPWRMAEAIGYVPPTVMPHPSRSRPRS